MFQPVDGMTYSMIVLSTEDVNPRTSEYINRRLYEHSGRDTARVIYDTKHKITSAVFSTDHECASFANELIRLLVPFTHSTFPVDI